MFAVDARTGEMLWSHWLGDPLMSAPTIAGGPMWASGPARTGLAPATSAIPGASGR